MLVAPALIETNYALYISSQVVYALLLALVLFLGFLATVIDPTDKAVLTTRELRKIGREYESHNHVMRCSLCASYVAKHTKHCGSCNRCCDQFDHHCNWLNTCVGKANYLTFFLLIVVTWISVAFYMSLSIYVVVVSYSSSTQHNLTVYSFSSVYGTD